MTEASSFPLRMRDPRIRALVREVAARDHLSQNALIEQAVANEVIARGGLIAADLAAAAERLAKMSAAELDTVVTDSIAEFAEGEARPDPLRPQRVQRPGRLVAPSRPERVDDPLGVMTAFHAGA
jgi:hypothetical protein